MWSPASHIATVGGFLRLPDLGGTPCLNYVEAGGEAHVGRALHSELEAGMKTSHMWKDSRFCRQS